MFRLPAGENFLSFNIIILGVLGYLIIEKTIGNLEISMDDILN